jgi:redox-sensitive bicupin YhaK (pirin superfamily)
MTRPNLIINATMMGDHALRLIGTTDIDGNGTHHEVEAVDPIVLFDFVKINTRADSPFRPHPHFGLTAMSFLPAGGTWMAWDSLEGDSEQHLETGGLYYVHAGTPAFHHEFPSPETVAAAMQVEFVQLVWNATDEEDVRTVVVRPEDVPVVSWDHGSLRVLAGDFYGASAIQPFTNRKIIYTYVQLDRRGRMDVPIPSNMRGMLFVIEGKLDVNDATVGAEQMMILGGEDSELAITNLEDDCATRFIIAVGEPINRPFFKLLGLGGFIIGETEEEVRSKMAELTETAEHIKRSVPQYFPAQYL